MIGHLEWFAAGFGSCIALMAGASVLMARHVLRHPQTLTKYIFRKS